MVSKLYESFCKATFFQVFIANQFATAFIATTAPIDP